MRKTNSATGSRLAAVKRRHRACTSRSKAGRSSRAAFHAGRMARAIRGLLNARKQVRKQRRSWSVSCDQAGVDQDAVPSGRRKMFPGCMSQ
jgi:hypothetical protein